MRTRKKHTMNGCKTPLSEGKEASSDAQLVDGSSRCCVIDVTEVARQVGWSVPVAFTQSALEFFVRAPARVYAEDEEERLKDVLKMARMASTALQFVGGSKALCLQAQNLGRPDDAFELKAVCDLADDGTPVVTIMRPDEE